VYFNVGEEKADSVLPHPATTDSTSEKSSLIDLPREGGVTQMGRIDSENRISCANLIMAMSNFATGLFVNCGCGVTVDISISLPCGPLRSAVPSITANNLYPR